MAGSWKRIFLFLIFLYSNYQFLLFWYYLIFNFIWQIRDDEDDTGGHNYFDDSCTLQLTLLPTSLQLIILLLTILLTLHFLLLSPSIIKLLAIQISLSVDFQSTRDVALSLFLIYHILILSLLFKQQKMNIFHNQTFVLTFVDEVEEEVIDKKQLFRPQVIRDEFTIDFNSLLDQQLSIQPQQMIFNTKIKQKAEKAQQIEEAVRMFQFQAKNAGFIVERERKKSNFNVKLLNVETISTSPFPEDNLDEWIKSYGFQIIVKFFVVLNFVGLLLTDYSFRIESRNLHASINSNPSEQDTIIPLTLLNIVSLHFQLLSNCAFSVEIVCKLFCKKTFFNVPWNLITLIGCCGCWASIFMDYDRYDGEFIFHILFCLKIMLAIRIIEVFQTIKIPFENFISTIPQLCKIFFTYFVFIIFFSTLGLVLFSGATQNRCRATPQPVGTEWPQIATNMCGSSLFQCQQGYCGNPRDYGLALNTTQASEHDNYFGLVSFNNIGEAIFVTYHYIYLSNWSSIMFNFSRFINPYITLIYFFTLALFLFFIMSNLNMITMCKLFIEKQKKKESLDQKAEQQQNKNLQNSQQNEQNQQTPSSFLKRLYTLLEYLDIFLVVVSSTVILIQYENMPQIVTSVCSYIDFVGTCLLFLILLAKTVVVRKKIFKLFLELLDWVLIIFSFADYTYCYFSGKDIFDPQNQMSVIFRSLKVVRLLKILYFSEKWFSFEKTILRMLIQTLNTIKYFLLLLFCVILILASIGQNLFANRVVFDHQTYQTDYVHGTSFIANFDNLYKAIVSVFYLLENQRWTQTMYYFYNSTGVISIFYFISSALIIHLLLGRLFLAIFLCYFRRNLEKQEERGKKNQSVNIISETNSNNTSSMQIKQFLQKQITEQHKDEGFNQKARKDKDEDKCKDRQDQFIQLPVNETVLQTIKKCSILQNIQSFYTSKAFAKVQTIFILIHSLTIIIRTSQDQDQKVNGLLVVERICLYFYFLQVLLGLFTKGLSCSSESSYLSESKLNFINVIVVILTITSQFTFIGELQRRIIRRFTILKIFTLFKKPKKETSIVLRSITTISEKFLRMIGIYIFLLIFSCLLPLKLEKGNMATCFNLPKQLHQIPKTYTDCIILGGDWVKDDQQFSNIFQSLVLMYQIVTSESWMVFVDKFNNEQPWDLFFVINFFVFNLCLLNIFVGLNVETYLVLKQEAYNLNILRPKQRMWLLIRNCINELVPIPIIKQPQTRNKFRLLAYHIITQAKYENFIDILPFVNIFITALSYYRADESYLKILDLLHFFIIWIFFADTILKLQLHFNFFYLNNSRVQLLGFCYHIIYFAVTWCVSLTNQNERILNFFSTLMLLLRCKKLLFRFTWSKTLLNSVIDILPKCAVIGGLMAGILFFYISVGMQLFKYTKPNSYSDGYTTGFSNALTSFMTLLKIVSNQSWFNQVSSFVRTSSPIDICFYINSVQQGERLKGMGCGSKAGYIYFVSFHMIIALLVLNLLIATMVAAYDQNYQKQYKSVNIFQLQDCINLWQKYDPEGTGLIPYKQFWRLSSQIAILFGINKKALIKGKQKFLNELNIDIYQGTMSSKNSVLCYRFHDVIRQFSKIKLTVSKSDVIQSSDNKDFQIDRNIESELKDYIKKTPQIYEGIKKFKNCKSGQMKYFFGLLRKLRAWRIRAKYKNSNATSKFSLLIQGALQKKKRQQSQLAFLRNSKLNNK